MRPNEPDSTPSPRAWPRRALIGLAFVVPAGVYIAVRFGAATPFAVAFTGACQRLQQSGLPITSKDWFCNPVPWTEHAAYLGVNFLVWLMFVIPCSILAVTGRRFTALLPMLVAPFFTFVGFDIFHVQWWGTAYWPAHQDLAIALNLACLILPVAAVSLANRGRRPRSGGDPWMTSVFVSTALLVAPTIGVVRVARMLFAQHFAQIGGAVTWKQLAPGVVSMAVFGALLGPNRKWWPWSVAPVAVLLSLGPVGALLWGPQRFQIWSQFGAAVPLAALGLLWAAWWPLAMGITRKTRRTRPATNLERTLAVPLETEDEEAAPLYSPPARGRGVRPGVVLNSVAISLLAISLIMFRADPMLVQINTPFPTFLGPRANWQDVRTRLDLLQAMSAMDAYAATHGGYRGFNAAAGVKSDPSLAWANLGDLPRGHSVPWLTMFVATHGTRARIGAVSGSGAAFCIGRAGSHLPLTYGSASATRGAGGWASSVPSVHARTLLGRALAACGQAPWTSHLVTALPINSLCDGVDEHDGGYIECRMIQALGVQIMSSTKPY